MSAVGPYDLCWESEAAVWRAEFDDVFLFGDAVRKLAFLWNLEERACEMVI